MLDISAKTSSLRTAVAQAVLRVDEQTIVLIRDKQVPKGDPFEVARVAAVQAAKNTSQIIPYCHPLPVDYVGVKFDCGVNNVAITVTVKAIYKTGVEMEALTAASVAALTVYDMCKMLDESMEILGVKLVSKKGGKKDFAEMYESPLRAAVLVSSDSASAGKSEDISGRLIVDRLTREGFEVMEYKVIPDEPKMIRKALETYTDDLKVELVITTGGTGFGPRDNTPEVMKMIIEKEIPGVPEAIRTYGQERTPFAMLSRSSAGIRGKTVIINLPGSKKGVAESLDALFPGIMHSFKMLQGVGHPEQPLRKEDLKA